EGRRAIEVVEKAGVGRRAVAELGLWKQLKDRSREHMGGGVTIDFQGFLVAVSHQAEFNVVLERLAEIGKLPAVFRLRRVHAGRGLASVSSLPGRPTILFRG